METPKVLLSNLHKKGEVKIVKPIFITGESGVGKDYASDLLAGRLGGKYVSLDSFGSQEPFEGRTRWVVRDPERLTDFVAEHDSVRVISGTCDNLHLVLKSLLERDMIGSFYVQQAAPRLFRFLQGLKEREGMRKHLPEEWINGWHRKAHMSDVQISQMYDDTSWGYITLLFEAVRREFVVGQSIEELISPLSLSEKFKVWAERLKPLRSEVLHVIDEYAKIPVEYLLNDASEKDRMGISEAWHRSLNQINPRISK